MGWTAYYQVYADKTIYAETGEYYEEYVFEVPQDVTKAVLHMYADSSSTPFDYANVTLDETNIQGTFNARRFLVRADITVGSHWLQFALKAPILIGSKGIIAPTFHLIVYVEFDYYVEEGQSPPVQPPETQPEPPVLPPAPIDVASALGVAAGVVLGFISTKT